VSGAGGTIIIAPQEHLAFLPASAGFQAKDFPHASQANLLLAPATIDPFRRSRIVLQERQMEHAHAYVGMALDLAVF
jgi:hypothetical protein